MKSTKRDITWFKTVRDKIRTHVNLNGESFTKSEMDSILKGFATNESEKYAEGTNFNVSCSDISHEDFQELKEWVKMYGELVGFEVDEYNDLNFNR